jgi:hypothetical protein
MEPFEIPNPPAEISLAGHEELRPRLKYKLAEYRDRLANATEMTSVRQVDAAHKLAVFSRLIESPDGNLVTADAKLLVFAELGSKFNSWRFNNAVNVLAGYIGVHPEQGELTGGTGLSETF